MLTVNWGSKEISLKLIVFAGRSDTGKTTLLQKVIRELKKRDYSVGVIKWCSQGFSLDKKGTDSWLLSEAGADSVALTSQDKSAVMINHASKPGIKDTALRYFKDMDIVISEGGRRETQLKKIEMLRKGVHESPEIPAQELMGIIADFDVPGHSPVLKPDQIKKIADLIEARLKEDEFRVSLEVNDKAIGLNDFLQKEFVQVLRAVLSPLHGVDKYPQEIDLKIQDENQIYLKINQKRVGLNRFLRRFICHMIFGMTRTLKEVPIDPEKLALSVKQEV
ncbi:MAG: molybdopterin-guanine dinucleotide biosynthesis protein B [Candidatus Aminicenantes bacterium]|nr:molybdopterin-guanine dinucleotide biosynthesis protein B [Candidatus Aminicenantes bacterium]